MLKMESITGSRIANRNNIFGSDRITQLEKTQRDIRNIVDINQKGVKVRYISHYDRSFAKNKLNKLNSRKISIFDDVHMETGTKLSLDKLQVRLDDEPTTRVNDLLVASSTDGDVVFSDTLNVNTLRTVDLFATGFSKFGSNSIEISGGVFINDVNVKGNLIADNIRLRGDVSAGNPIVAINNEGDLGYANNMKIFNDVIKVNSDVLMNEALRVKRNVTMDRDLHVSGSTVTTDSYVNSNLVVSNVATIGSNINISGSAIVDSNVYANNDIIVKENAIFKDRFRIINGEISGNLYMNGGFINISGDKLILRRNDLSDTSGVGVWYKTGGGGSGDMSGGSLMLGDGELTISGDQLYVNGEPYTANDIALPNIPYGADLSNGYILMYKNGELAYVPNMYVVNSGIEIDGNLYITRKGYARNFITMSTSTTRQDIEANEATDYQYYLDRLMELMTPDNLAFSNLTIAGNLRVEGDFSTPSIDASQIHTNALCLTVDGIDISRGNPVIASGPSGCLTFATNDYFNDNGLYVTGDISATNTVYAPNVDASYVDASEINTFSIETNRLRLDNGQRIVPGNPLISQDASGVIEYATDAIFSEERVDLSGTLQVTNRIFTQNISTRLNTSDRRVKQNIRLLEKNDYEKTVDKFMSIPMYEYEFKPSFIDIAQMKKGKKFKGYMAQEFEKVYPDSIVNMKNTKHSSNKLPETIKSIDMNKEFLSHDMPVLLKYLINENQSLKNRLKALEDKMNK
jgi:hypothetical protein